MHALAFDSASMEAPPSGALQQHPLYAACLARLGAQVLGMELHADGRRLGRAQVYKRRLGGMTCYWLPRGPIWEEGPAPDRTRQALAALRKTAGRGVWLISSETENRPGPGLCVARGPTLAELDLTLSPATRLAAQHGKWRNRLRRAERMNLEVEHLPLGSSAGPLLARELAQRRARRYAALPPRFTEAWAALAPDATRLFLARKTGRTIAFMLFLLHGAGATYHLGWTGSEGRAASAHHLLLVRAADWLAGRGHLRLDLGPVDPANPGLARFKLASGAQARQLGPTRLLLG